jgi:hopene-associated glycosyltransferase HpnB
MALAIWLYLAVARGTFWRLREFDDDTAQHESPCAWPPVVAVIPARNEAATIAQTLASLLNQDYAGEFSVVLVDDHSEDATAQIAQQAAHQLNAESRVNICTAPALPPGWTGKLWALNEGVSQATPATPTYYWFTDADSVHAPDTLRRLVSRAERDHLDLASLMVLLQAKTFPERALIPAFLFFFLKLYPPRWIASPKARTAGAAGGCILLRSEALQRIGGFAAIRHEVIDDCALASAVKRSGGRLWMGLTRAGISLRAYTTFREIRDLIARTAFTQLRYSPPAAPQHASRNVLDVSSARRASLRAALRTANPRRLRLATNVPPVSSNDQLLSPVPGMGRNPSALRILLHLRHMPLRSPLLPRPRRAMERPRPSAPFAVSHPVPWNFIYGKPGAGGAHPRQERVTYHRKN